MAQVESQLAQPVAEAAPASRRTLTRMMVAIVAAYLLFAAMLYLWRGIYFAPDPPDSWAALLLVGAVALGRWKAFLRDWVPLVALIFGYELLRGFAGTVTSGGALTPAYDGAIDYRWLLAADTWLGRGAPLTLRLQRTLYTPGALHWWDGLAVVIYSLHFALPLVFGYLLWVRDRERFRRFAAALLFMTYTTFVIFLLMPTAPPWLVNVWGYLPGIADPFAQGGSTGLPRPHTAISTLTIWTKASPDAVAAFPSLHAAYPWLVLLFLVRFFGRRGWLFLGYNLLVWFSVVYLAQHWVVDVLAGIVWASLSFVIVETCWSRLHHEGESTGVIARRTGAGLFPSS
jgi:membrane-associated phospholipid phosphatase